MLFDSPVRGTIRPDRRHYPDHPRAKRRPRGSRIPLVTQDFGPSDVKEERSIDWPGGEIDIMGDKIKKKRYDNFHQAIDISKGRCSGAVLAAAGGKIKSAVVDGSGAGVIVINHGTIDGHKYETRYVHLQVPLMELPAQVDAGTLIGIVGTTGVHSTGCHLHFAVTKDGLPVDPWRRLKQNTTVDPDVPTTPTPNPPPAEVPDVPIPASQAEYVAGKLAVIGNDSIGARVRAAPKESATLIRTISGGSTETWLPTCFVVGESAFGSDRWLTRWFNNQWEFTHSVNVDSIAPIATAPIPVP
jgi:hypothetical protein